MKKIFLNLLEKTLKILARLYIKKYDPCVVGITGNVGKTSAREAIGRVIQKDRSVRAAGKNFNNELGMPLSILGDFGSPNGFFFWVVVVFRSIWGLLLSDKNYPEVLVLEYGIDRPADMNKLLEIARPHIGIFTAVGDTPVHIEFFPSADAVGREKGKLIGALPATGFAILNGDDERVLATRENTRARVVTYGFSESVDVRITNFKHVHNEDGFGAVFKLSYAGTTVPFRVAGALGKSTAYTIAAAAAVGFLFNVNLLDAAEIFSVFQSPRGRKNILKGIKHSFIIDDTYNAAPQAMEEALAILKSIPGKRKIAVLGDMLELGVHSIEAHERLGRFVRESADLLFTVGARGRLIAEAAAKAGMQRKKIFSFTNIHELSMQLSQKIQRDDLILVKASQGVRMERVVKSILADSIHAEQLLVRQEPEWLRRPGLYD